MTWILTITAYFTSLIAVALIAFFGVIVLAGPHGGLLPNAWQGPLILFGWLCVLLIPPWVGWIVWRWSRTRHDPPTPGTAISSRGDTGSPGR